MAESALISYKRRLIQRKELLELLRLTLSDKSLQYKMLLVWQDQTDNDIFEAGKIIDEVRRENAS